MKIINKIRQGTYLTRSLPAVTIVTIMILAFSGVNWLEGIVMGLVYLCYVLASAIEMRSSD